MMRMWLLAIPALLLLGCAPGKTNSTASTSATPTGNTVAIAVTEDGFTPSEFTVQRGVPVTLVVTRKTDRTCAKEFVMEAQHIRKQLPLNQAVAMKFTPDQPGEVRFACGMDMVSGTMTVR